jgi:hypothetical protein
MLKACAHMHFQRLMHRHMISVPVLNEARIVKDLLFTSSCSQSVKARVERT